MIDRLPSREELAIFERYKREIIKGRPYMSGYLGACDCLAQIEEWRRKQVAAGMISDDFLPVMFSKERIAAAEKRASQWNILENGLRGLQSGNMGFQVAPNKRGEPDIDIYMKPLESLQGVVVLLVIGASVVIGGIITAIALRNQNQEDARKMKKELAFLNQRMSAAPKQVRDAFVTLQTTPQYTKPKSLWDDIGDKMKGIGVVALVIAGAFLLSRRQPENSAPVSNPCKQSTPLDWDVQWSKDPEKAERQLEYILDNLRDRSLAKRWRGFFSGWADGGEEEVPF